MAHGCAELVVTKSSSEYPRVAKKIEPTQNASCIENDNTCRRLVGTCCQQYQQHGQAESLVLNVVTLIC